MFFFNNKPVFFSLFTHKSHTKKWLGQYTIYSDIGYALVEPRKGINGPRSKSCPIGKYMSLK